ncbi:MAG TPA: HAD hydrolase-like protein [Gemmatimonadaceae bacterium]|nr:HAD hydrolase-like protein [Gemmatimonadaceae bacterium]
MKLVLFDIDGTLLLSDGAGRRAINRALHEVYGGIGPQDYRFDGKTDPQIVRDLMRIEGHPDAHIDARMRNVFERYLAYLDEELSDPAHRPYTLPGVPELLDVLERDNGIVLGLLTGNVRDGARAKLQAVGIDFDRFRVGAFGSDHEHRPELPAIARTRASSDLGLDLHGTALVVIGDTPADLSCGKSIGAKAIGVATGRYSVTDLQRHDPSAAVFADLSDTAAVHRAILTS